MTFLSTNMKKIKVAVGNLNRSINILQNFIVIIKDGCFIFLTNIKTVYKEIKFVIQLML